MSPLRLHPTIRLVLWLLLLVAVQSMNGAALVAALLLLPILGCRILQHGGRLVRRARWLLISMLVIFFWNVPGDPLWNGPLAPTHQGIGEGLTQLGRLLLVLMSVAAFLETMPIPDLLSATHTLFKPLRRFGLDSDRGVVRLMLALQYFESLPRPRDWRNLLDVPAASTNEYVELKHRLLRWPDYVVLIALAVAMAFYVFR